MDDQVGDATGGQVGVIRWQGAEKPRLQATHTRAKIMIKAQWMDGQTRPTALPRLLMQSVNICIHSYWSYMVWPHHACDWDTPVALASKPIKGWVQVVHRLLSGHAPKYLDDNINLGSLDSDHLFLLASNRCATVPGKHRNLGDVLLVQPSVLWRCWLGDRKSIRPVKNWVVRCWHGYLSGARCRLAYGPADSTATHCLLLQ